MTSYYRADISVLPGPDTSIVPYGWLELERQKALAEIHGLAFHRVTEAADDSYRVLFEAWTVKPDPLPAPKW